MIFETKKRIDKIIKTVNSMSIVPKYWFRRNHKGYKVVSAVNNVIGLYLSDELEDFFIDRIETELKKVSKEEDSVEYIKLVRELSLELHKYLTQKTLKK